MPMPDPFSGLAEDLMAYCLIGQGRENEAVARLEDLAGRLADPELQLILGQLYARRGDWPQAVETWLSAAHGLQPATPSGCHAAELLLSGAIELSGRGNRVDGMRCLSAAERLFPGHALLEALPADLQTHRPTVSFAAGDYPAAIGEWESRLQQNGYAPETIHSLSIAHQCMLEAPGDLAPQERLLHLERAYRGWIALGHDTAYWRVRYERQRPAYGDGIALEEFIGTASQMGVSRCHAVLPGLREQCTCADPPVFERL